MHSQNPLLLLYSKFIGWLPLQLIIKKCFIYKVNGLHQCTLIWNHSWLKSTHCHFISFFAHKSYFLVVAVGAEGSNSTYGATTLVNKRKKCIYNDFNKWIREFIIVLVNLPLEFWLSWIQWFKKGYLTILITV